MMRVVVPLHLLWSKKKSLDYLIIFLEERNKLSSHTCPWWVSNNVWGRSQFSCHPKPFPRAVFPWDSSPVQAYKRAALPGFCRSFAWCSCNLLETQDSLNGTCTGGPRIPRKIKYFMYEWQSSAAASEVSRYPGVRCSEKLLNPQIPTRQTSK